MIAKVISVFIIIVVSCTLILGAEYGARLYYRIKNNEWPQTLYVSILEGRSQMSRLFIDHPILPFTLRPSIESIFMDSKVSINNSGFRGKNLKRKSHLRILVVGGSTTFDVSVTDNEHTWCSVLESKLKSYFPGIEIINAGMPAVAMYGNYLKYIFYDRKLRPDIVLIYQGLNDTETQVPKEIAKIYSEDYWYGLGSVCRWWAGTQHVSKDNGFNRDNFILYILRNSIIISGAHNKRGTERVLFSNWVPIGTPDFLQPNIVEKKQLFVDFINAIRSDGCIPIFVPQSIGNEKRNGGPNFIPLFKALKYVNDAYIQVCHNLNVSVLDIQDQILNFNDSFFKDAIHFNNKGSSEFASVLAKEIIQRREFYEIYSRISKSRTLPDHLKVYSPKYIEVQAKP
jgi:lysophospholipase L1-like esterase